MNSKTKSESDSLLRIPKAKNKLGLKIPKIAMPHDDLIVSEKPKLEIVPSKTSLSSQSIQTKQTDSSVQETAPSKNYQKVANSITKQAIPDGFFKGKDKHLYDVLYSLTRGAIEPTRKTRISKMKLMKLSGIGSRITFDSCIKRLESVKLLKLKVFTGEHKGNEFEIFLPEEVKSMTSQTSLTSHTNPPQKLDRLVILETSQTSQSPEPITAGISDTPKTSLKTNTKNDDDARADEVFSVMTKRLDAAVKKLTGKPSSRIEAEKWGTLAELLILEMEVAASRTETISSVPAFLTEILRRKLLHGSNSAPAELPKAKTDTVGRPSAAGEYEIKPLNEQSRQSALLELREFIGEEFLKDFQKWYTPGDWKWLTHELDKIQESGK